MTSNVTNLSKSRRLDDDKSCSSEPAKVNARKCTLLQLLVDTAWEKEVIKDLPEWLTSQGIDVDRPDWHYSWKSANKGSAGRSKLDSNKTTDKDTFKNRITTKLHEILHFLLKCDDDVNFIDDLGQTFLQAYIVSSHSDYRRKSRDHKSKILGTVKFLIDEGASLDAVDVYGRTPILLAAEHHKLEIVRLMLALFTVVDFLDNDGCTLLHHVAGSDVYERDLCLEIVEILMSKGADPNLKNREGMTSLQVAVKKGNLHLLRLFKENGANFSVTTRNNDNLLLLSFSSHYCAVDDSQFVDFLVNEGCHVNSRNNDGCSPLHLAVKSGRSFDRLVELGADVDCQTTVRRRTPLHYAARSLKYEFIAKLCRAGADCDALDSEGKTPLDLTMGDADRLPYLPELALKLGGNVNNRQTVDAFGKCGKRVRDAVISHAGKLRMLGLPVHEAYVDRRKVDRGYRERLLAEVEKMKNHVVKDGMSIYDFLHANWRCQLACVDLLPGNLELQFPNFASFVRVAGNKALRRVELFGPAKVAWYRATEVYLPDLCVERIIGFLDNWHLKVLIDAAGAEKTLLPRKISFVYTVPEDYESLCRWYYRY